MNVVSRMNVVIIGANTVFMSFTLLTIKLVFNVSHREPFFSQSP